MKVLETRKIEGCIESANAIDILFDEIITTKFIFSLEKLGKLIYHGEFDKPYFRLIVKGKFSFKGSEGNSSARMIFSENFDKEQLDSFVSQIEEM